ncbi:3-deoxy-manno-octulosonate cytidylyltransferase [Pollutibacter soli]|uniref:3-deoxy-manno-octulosonate cytidylyltransferase n=1 Tax=Pollutibacter soli TaxID=3034157 RepID=UPI00301402B9
MSRIALIPARYGATRFPGKLLADLAGKPVIIRTYETVYNTGLFDRVVVVADGDEIESVAKQYSIEVVRSKKEHESGSDRIAEAVADIDTEIVVNVQGDEPFADREALKKLLEVFEGEAGKSVKVASLMQVLKDGTLINDPNYVKVIVDLNFNSLLFSRSPLPYVRDHTKKPDVFEHIGVYAFRKQALMDFAAWPVTPLEAAEKIECLRYLEHGVKLKMVLTKYMGVEIDTPEDLVRANELFKNRR